MNKDNINFLFNKTGRALKLSLLFSFFLVLTLLPLVLAAPPVTTVQSITEGYMIEDSPLTYIKQSTDYQYNFFVFNISNGALKTNTSVSCIHYIANSQGGVIYYEAVKYQPDGYWGTLIKGGNFSNTGTYAYGTRCNSTALAGATVGTLEVTPNGEEAGFNFEPSIFLGLLFVSFIILILSFIFKNYIFSFFAGMLLLITGSYCMINGFAGATNTWTYTLAVILIGLGGLITILSGLDLLGNVEGKDDTEEDD